MHVYTYINYKHVSTYDMHNWKFISLPYEKFLLIYPELR